ncbi:MAG: cyclic nucleotide-binding domain-containing protein [Deltaproteobacteria bacterium]|nr:cyclic nucleotide-binding domain-containing protein [Deltaproteobacteria bacterium]
MGSDEKAAVPVVRLELKHVNLRQLVEMDEFLGTAPLFRAAGQEGTQRLIDNAVPRRLAAGQAIFREGDAGNSLFLVLRGEVTLGHDAAVIASVRKGDFFGEAEVLAPRSLRGCNATAADAADVAEFPLADIAAVVQKQVAVLALLRDARDERAKANSELDDFLNRW